MRRSTRFATACAILAASSLAAGCGKSSPTAPAPPAAPAAQWLQQTEVIFTQVHVTHDGDLIGPGEFTFKWGAGSESSSKSATLSDGDDLKLGNIARIGGDGRAYTVSFEATEWDKDILGNSVRDPNMDRRSESVTYSADPSNRGDYSITLGNDACKVRLDYTIQPIVVQAQP